MTGGPVIRGTIRPVPSMIREDERLGRKCPECGGRFSCGSDWGYAYGSYLFCSWRCLRSFERTKHGNLERRQQWKSSAEGCRVRAELCRQKIRSYTKRRAECQDQKKRDQLSVTILGWRDCLEEAEELLRLREARIG